MFPYQLIFVLFCFPPKTVQEKNDLLPSWISRLSVILLFQKVKWSTQTQTQTINTKTIKAKTKNTKTIKPSQ